LKFFKENQKIFVQEMLVPSRKTIFVFFFSRDVLLEVKSEKTKIA